MDNAYGKWTKSGYTLVSWNTKADGSGKRHALGAMINMPDESFTLYAQYEKQTEADLFEYREYIGNDGEQGYEITAYNSNAEKQVIAPDVYNGKKSIVYRQVRFL